MLVTKTGKTVTKISKLSLTHLVSNIRHQHRCSLIHESWLYNHFKNRLILHFVRRQEDQFKPRHVRCGVKRIARLPIGVNGSTAIVILDQMVSKVSVLNYLSVVVVYKSLITVRTWLWRHYWSASSKMIIWMRIWILTKSDVAIKFGLCLAFSYYW